MSGKVIKVFPGGNTAEGFYSFYPYLLEKGEQRVFILKGGPGVGKSTLMRRVGQKMLTCGYNVEFHHCSSDSNSLDGIAVPEVGVVIVDGTTPHIIDPKYPGVVDEIVNLGEFWDEVKLKQNWEKIKASTDEVSRHFARAYSFLKAARSVAENISDLYRRSMDFAKVNKLTAQFLDLLKSTYSQEKVGRERHLFSCAYTPEGFVDFSASIVQQADKIYYLKGEMGTGKSTLLEKVASQAIAKGLDTEIYHTPLIPRKIGTVLIKDLGLAITTSAELEDKKELLTGQFDLNRYLDRKMTLTFQDTIESDNLILTELIEKGLSCIREAKAEHDILEQYYIPNLDFAAVREKGEEIISAIFRLVGGETAATAFYH
ncbi:MAG: PRK06851 family protein [Desulfitobacteriia bacterium]|jgi:hypothetical protein